MQAAVAPDSGGQKTAILVAGMHRSGTSALTRMMSLLGYDLPNNLLEPSKSNEKDFWESPAVNRLNDEILAAAGMTWRDWRSFEPGWENSPQLTAFKDKALTLLDEEFASSQFLVLKDPRICRLIGFWRGTLETFGAKTIVACVVRDPLEVAASLNQRNGIDPALSHLIWLRYVLESEFATRDMPRSFTSYDQILTDWRAVSQRIASDLNLSWPRPVDEAASQIGSFLSNEGRPSEELPEAVVQDPGFPEWLRTTFAISERWARDGEDRSDWPELNRIREEFDRAGTIFAPLIGKADDMHRHLATADAAQIAELESAASRVAHDLDVERKGKAELLTALERARSAAEPHQARSSRIWQLARGVTRVAVKAKRIASRRRAPSEDPGEEVVAFIGASDLLDRDWYLAWNADVAASGMDPARHYVLFGAAEGRDPGPAFSTRQYLETHADVAEAGVNPLAHYLLHGKEEGRQIVPSSIVAADSATPAIMEDPVAAADPVSFPRSSVEQSSWTQQPDFVRTDSRATFELSGTILGTTSAEESEIRHALEGAGQAIASFCRLIGKEAQHELCCYAGEATADIAGMLNGLADAKGPIPFFQVERIPTGIADIWFANDRDLRIRFASMEEPVSEPCIVRFFRVEGEGKLTMASEAPLAREIEFIDVPLANPYMPVLMTATTPEGLLLAASLIPFPSLCRGGAHYAELCAIGTGTDYLASLREISGRLLSELLDEGSEEKLSISQIAVDLQGATGAERIFSRDVQEWLALVMRIRATAAKSLADSRSKARAHLEQNLASLPLTDEQEHSERIKEREKAGALRLALPPDGIPSLNALVSRRLGGGGGPSIVGSFVIAENGTAEPRWAITVPPLGEEFVAVQPANAAVSYPILERISSEAGKSAENLPMAFPLAVRFADTHTRHESSLIMATAPDWSGPLLRKEMSKSDRASATISVLLPRARASAAFTAFLESLRLQTMADKVDIVIAGGSAADEKAAMREVLQRLFAGRYLMIEQDGALNLTDAVNLAASRAKGKFLLVASEEVLLHDQRTLETLCLLADQEKVASAGCVLLHDAVSKGQAVAFRSGGIFLSDSRSPSAENRFSEPDCYSALPSATYPVAANSFALFMVRADNWKSVKDFDTSKFSDMHADIDYGLRALAEGFNHLCTSAVSAGLTGTPSRALYVDAKPPIPPSIACRDIALSTSTLRALRG